MKATFFALSLACNCACSPGHETLIPKEILFGNPEKYEPTLSPDGTKLGFLAPDEKNVLNIWVKDLATSKEEKISSDEKRGIRFYLWQYDAQHVLYLQDKDGDENFHLYQTNLATKETRCLTPFPEVIVSPISYLPENPNQILTLMNLQNPALLDVYGIDLTTGEVELVHKNTDGSFQFLADTHSQIRASARYGESGETIISARADLNSEWKELIRWSPEESGSLVSFTPDGTGLYMVSSLEANTARLIRVDLADGSKTAIAEDPNYDLFGFIANPISHKLEAIRVNREKPEWIVLDPGIEEDFSLLQKKDESLSLLSRDLEDKRWIIEYAADTHGSRYYLYDRETKKTEFLFAAKPQLEQYSLSPMQPISFTARDGMTLHGYLTLPKEKEAKDLPAILFVHGGPWARDNWGCHPVVQWLANRGYAVLQVNFRGSVGYGKDYLNAGNREWGGKMHTDILDGKQWLLDQQIADPKRIAIAGGSYGGYETLVALAFTPQEFCCGVDIVGPSNIVSLLENAPPYWRPFMAIFNTRVGNVETEREFLESRSPLFKADQICRPLLIIQGANDPRVKQAESDQIVEAIRKNGKEVEYRLIDDEGHGFARPENMLSCIELWEQFLEKHLK